MTNNINNKKIKSEGNLATSYPEPFTLKTVSLKSPICENNWSDIYLSSLQKTLNNLYTRQVEAVNNGNLKKNFGIYWSIFWHEYLAENPEIDEDDVAQAQARIMLFDLLGCLSEQEQYALFDSGVFNDVVKGYMQYAIESLPIKQSIKDTAIWDCRKIFDFIGAKKAEKHWYGEY